MEVTDPGAVREATSSGLDLEQQTIHNMLATAVVDIDLQLYKGSVYKLRWGSPGVGLDMAIPCYQLALRTAEETRWPAELRPAARDLAERIGRYIATLEARDATSASGQHSQLMASLGRLREQARAWPDSPAAGDG
jgi:hypothetical protein